MPESAKPLPKPNAKFYGIAVFLKMIRRGLRANDLPIVLVSDDPDRSMVIIQVYPDADACNHAVHVKHTMMFDTPGVKVKQWLDENASDYLGLQCEVRLRVI